MTIDILMMTDSNYITPARVAMYSVCINKNPETKIVFTMLCDKDLDEMSRKRLSVLEEIFLDIKVVFCEVEKDDFIYAESSVDRIPILSFYRLVAAKVLNVKKAICLDSDLVVQMDLAGLYEIDMEGYYIAGVRDLWPVSHPNFAMEYAENYNINNFSDYVNCGVLLMNLEQMRRDNIVEIFIKELAHKNLWLDQDIFNRVCSGKIQLLDWRFNHVATFTREDYELNCEQNYKSIEHKSKKEIVHFCGPSKPWENCYLRMASVWWDVAKEALERTEYDRLYSIASIGYGSARMIEIINKCSGAETVIIVGYSDHGLFIRKALLKYGITADIFFADNNPRKRELMLGNNIVFSLEDALREYKNAIWVNAVQKARNEILAQLRELKIPDEQVVNYLYE